MKVEESVAMAADASAAWAVVGDVGGLGAWLPGIGSVALDGPLRRITFAGGAISVEEVIAHSDAGRRYTYRYVKGPLLFRTYESTLAVTPAGAGCTVHWQASFEPVAPGDGERLQKIVARAYRAGLQGLQALLEA